MPKNLSFRDHDTTSTFYSRIHSTQQDNLSAQGLPPTVVEWSQWLEETYHEGGRGLNCLDAGCGLNAFASVLCAKHGFDQVHAVDINPDVESNLRQNPDANDIRFRQASVMDLPYEDNSFDLVVCRGVAHHTSDPIKAFSELARVCKPEGIIYLGLYCFGNSPFLLLVRIMRTIGRILPYDLVQALARKSPALNNFAMDHMFVPILWVFDAAEVRSILADLGMCIVEDWPAGFDFFQARPITRWLTGDGLFREFVCRLG